MSIDVERIINMTGHTVVLLPKTQSFVLDGAVPQNGGVRLLSRGTVYATCEWNEDATQAASNHRFYTTIKSLRLTDGDAGKPFTVDSDQVVLVSALVGVLLMAAPPGTIDAPHCTYLMMMPGASLSIAQDTVQVVALRRITIQN